MKKKDIDKMFDGLCSKAISCELMGTAISHGLKQTAILVFCENCPENDSVNSNPSRR